MMRAGQWLLAMFLGAALATVSFVAGAVWSGRAAVPGAAPASVVPAGLATAARLVQPRGDLAADEKATITLFEASSPSVVYITTLAVQQDLFSMNQMEIPRGSGSGFVWDRAGHVVTNFHVVLDADAAQVTLADHSTWPARLVGQAPEKDIAVLKIAAPAARLRPIPIGSSDDLRVGQKVFAIGNPFGFDQSLTTGIISALGREITAVTGTPIRDVIQTDAAINPGNSGGPLLDSSGRVIGVDTAIYSPSGASAGIGFAIPVHSVQWVVPELIAHGRIERPALGVELAPDPLVRRLGLTGALVLRVEAGTGAARAGLRSTRRDLLGRWQLGDTIVAVDGKPVDTSADLNLVLEQKRPGDTVRVTLLRDGRRLDAQVKLGPGRETAAAAEGRETE
jgi:protease Do-like 1, chloroplastic